MPIGPRDARAAGRADTGGGRVDRACRSQTPHRAAAGESSRCRRCRTKSSRLTKKRRQGRGRQVPRLLRRIEAVPTFIFDIVGAEKASKVNFLDELASCSKARARLQASRAENEQCISGHIKDLIARIVMSCSVAYVMVSFYPHTLSGLRSFVSHRDTMYEKTWLSSRTTRFISSLPGYAIKFVSYRNSTA